METNCIYLPYQQTGAFSNIVIDYLQQHENLVPFYTHAPNVEGIKNAIQARRQFPTDRKLLVAQLRSQYAHHQLAPLQEAYLQQLLQENTFTICTAHQPNIFTGHLYFIYKILHAIKLADTLRKQLPDNNFVPVYYMGSEDADLDELGHITIDGKEYKWNTKQTGAVGRMKVDKTFISLMDEMAGQLTIHPYGNELIMLLKSSYKEGITIQEATLALVQELFKDFGLLVLIPDNASLKQPFNTVVKRELQTQFSFPLVQKTTEELSQHYKVQAGGRPINLFYLLDDKRERIEKDGENYVVVNSTKQWNETALLAEVDEHPERFSTNVILRGVFQEMILPNVAFIGGGGEIAYWLELKRVFEACNVPFPVLVLRNSFMLADTKQQLVAKKLGFDLQDLFPPVDALVNSIVKKNSEVQLSLLEEKQMLEALYVRMQNISNAIDVSLTNHVKALHIRHAHQLTELEKKMLRAEKRKYEAQRRQITKVKAQLFPNNSLQERVDNFSKYYSLHGKGSLRQLYEASLSLEQEFCILAQ